MKTIFHFSLLLLIFSFHSLSVKTDLFPPTGPVQTDSLQGQSPYLTTDPQGHLVMSWVRMLNDSSSIFCYATVAADGKSFEKPITIPVSKNILAHSENLPKILFKPSGEIIACWGVANPNPKNKYSGLVYYSQSFDSGSHWTPAKPITLDTASFDQRYYDIALLENGEAGIIWLDNRKSEGEGSGLYFSVTRGREGFGEGRRIQQSCCQCCRTQLFRDSRGSLHILYRGIVQDSIRDIVHSVSYDNGKTFSAAARISNDNWVIRGCPHTGPSMTEYANTLHFSWFTGGKKKGCYYTSSKNDGSSFENQDSISASGSHPQITTLPFGGLVTVWDEPARFNGQLNRVIALERRDPQGRRMSVQYLTSESDHCSYPVIRALSTNLVLVAYTLKKDQQTFIRYRLVGL